MKLCEVCEVEPVAQWQEAFADMSGYMCVELNGSVPVCLGCAASNYDDLCCGTCRDTVCALVGIPLVQP
jgi:hypothetical protein